MFKIGIVEDDEKLRNEMEVFLNRNGYEVIKITNFEQVVEELTTQKIDLVLLDINLPFYDGEYICREVRKKSNIPIIMVTSKNTEIDELLSMNYGADDFVTKPYNTQILLAKIAAILRRVNQSEKNSNQINCGTFIVDISKSSILYENRTVELTKNELKIIYYLAQKKEQIVSRDEIMTYLWDGEMFVDDNTLTVNMNRLRKKLEDIGLENVIETKRGQGYILKEGI